MNWSPATDEINDVQSKIGFPFILIDESIPMTPRPQKNGSGRHEFQIVTERLTDAIIYL